MATQAHLLDDRPPLQLTLPPEAVAMGHVCRRCHTPVLVGERDAEGRWECRGCGRVDDQPLAVPVIWTR